MRIISSPKVFQSIIKKYKAKGRSIGFVPTMGALHDGHRSLIQRARRENDIVILSIFVNPTQFGPNEDFKKYPRTKRQDFAMAKKEKIDFVFFPSAAEMYGQHPLTQVHVSKLDKILCGRTRPGHFTGVATVVAKLLNIVSPDVIYLGQKDAQQAVILKKMVADLNFPVTVIICPTVREKDGLAMSSRNRYLSPRHRKEATILFRSLKLAKIKILTGERESTKIQSLIRGEIERKSSGKIEYVEIVDTDSLARLKILRGTMMIAVAVKFGQTRLIDNMILQRS